MTEAELLDLYFQIESTNNTLTAGMGSVTVALYTLAYVVGTNLNIRSLMFVIVTYCVIMGFCMFVNNGYLQIQVGVLESLGGLESDGAQLSYPSKILMDRFIGDSSPTKLILAFQILMMLFSFGGVAYLIHQYRKSRTLEENEID